MKPSKGIDTHAHVFSATAKAVAGARYRPGYEATLEGWRSPWSAAGISHGVLVQPSFFGTDNSEMLAAIARDPAHLRGVAVVDPSFDDAALGRLHAGGVRAIRLNVKGLADRPDHGAPGWRGLLERVLGRGWHVEVYADAGRLAELLPSLGPVPIPVVLDHFGNPGTGRGSLTATLAAAAELAASRPVWVKLSAPYRLEGADPAALATHWERVLGEEFLVWGSDWPCTNHEGLRDYARLRSALGEWVGVARAPGILWDNAARLYGF